MSPTLTNGVKARRTRHQSKTYSDLHRYAGQAILMLDIDSVEFDRDGNSLAIIETKHLAESFSNFQKLCITKLADKADLPAFEIRHDYLCSIFWIYPLNERAEQWLDRNTVQPATQLDRTAYLNFLCAIHSRRPSNEDVELFKAYQAEDA